MAKTQLTSYAMDIIGMKGNCRHVIFWRFLYVITVNISSPRLLSCDIMSREHSLSKFLLHTFQYNLQADRSKLVDAVEEALTSKSFEMSFQNFNYFDTSDIVCKEYKSCPGKYGCNITYRARNCKIGICLLDSCTKLNFIPILHRLSISRCQHVNM